MSTRRPPRFYAGPGQLQPGTTTLSADESRHARSSRRLGPGDEVVLFDGLGSEGAGLIAEIKPRAVRVTVREVGRRRRDVSVDLTLALAMPKGGRQDVFIEKCTELGVTAFWPMDCTRSVVRPAPGRIDKWRRIAIEACKQCGRAWLPSFAARRSFTELLPEASGFDAAFLACHSGAPLNTQSIKQDRRVLLLVGPEGGFTDQELSAAREARLQFITLSPTILRTETAAIAAAARIVGAVAD